MAIYVQIPLDNYLLFLMTNDKKYNSIMLLKNEGFVNFVEDYEQLIEILTDGKTVIREDVNSHKNTRVYNVLMPEHYNYVFSDRTATYKRLYILYTEQLKIYERCGGDTTKTSI